MKKRLVCALLAVLMFCLTGCSLMQAKVEDMSEEDAAPYYKLTEQFTNALFAQNYAATYSMLGENLQNLMSEAELQERWEQVLISYGDVVQTDSRKPYWINEEGTIISQVICEHGGCSIQLTFDETNGVAGLWFGLRDEPAPYALAVPQGVVEERVTLGEGTQYPLEAIITLPENYEGTLPAVVLVHGSGASDKNEAIGGCYPFADIAWGLAQQGIASIRYDKRTYTYGNDFSQEQITAMTVQEEVIDDALLAVDRLHGDVRMDSQRIVLLGHSLGGMLAPRIAQSTDKISGMISLAGSARGYLDIVYDQNLALVTKASDQNGLKKEYKKLEKLDSMKDSDTLFGIPVPYLKDLYAHPAKQSLGELSIPMLVLQGKNDFQVSLTDYKSWQDALADYQGATQYELFDNLNHLFVDNTDLKRRGTIAEYLAKGHVAQEVIDTIAVWMEETAMK